jgi:hypothetical protein
VTSLEWIAGRDWHRSTVSGGGAQSSQWNLSFAIVGVSNVSASPDWEESARRLVEILIWVRGR